MKPANEAEDRQKLRGATSETELHKLPYGARWRPLAEYGRTTIAKLEQHGRERALVYKTLVLTGLRRGELASIIVGQLLLEEVISGLELKAKDEKNREGSFIALVAICRTIFGTFGK